MEYLIVHLFMNVAYCPNLYRRVNYFIFYILFPTNLFNYSGNFSNFCFDLVTDFVFYKKIQQLTKQLFLFKDQMLLFQLIMN